MHSQRIVIVGGTSGIGLALARRLVTGGAEVVLVARNEPAKGSLPERTRMALGDIRSIEDLERIAKHIGTCNHVVVTAGTINFAPLVTAKAEELRQSFEERVFGIFNVVRSFVPVLRDGSFLFTSGSLVDRPAPGLTPVVGAIAAVEAIARSLSLELAPTRVNVVAPGTTRTPLYSKIFGDRAEAIYEERASASPIGRVAEADDVAAIMVAILQNRSMTGETVHVDGGARLV